MPSGMSDTITFQSPTLYSGLTGVVDFENAVIRGVSLIEGNRTAEGHDLIVDNDTLKQIYDLGVARGKVPVNLDHGSGIAAMNGYVTDIRMDGNKVRADWHLLRNHEETPVMLERADRNPECFGLSVAFKGKGVAIAGGKKAARAEKLLSVDCVTRPAANDGLFSSKDGRIVDMQKNNESDKPTEFNTMPNQDPNAEPTMQDILNAINGLGERVSAQEQFSQQVSDHLSQNQNQEDEGYSEEQIIGEAQLLDQLGNLSDQELAAQGISRQDIESAQSQFIDNFGHLFAGEEGEGEDAPYQDSYAGMEGQNGAMAGAEGGAAVGAGSEFRALQKQVIELQSKIRNEEILKVKHDEALRFSEINDQIDILTTQRNESVELAARLVSENEALRMSVSTGTRPVHASMAGERLFSANMNGELHDFQFMVKTYKDENKCTDGAAILFCSKERPDLHQDWLNSQRR